MDPSPTGLFGKYRLEERLGAGGLAEVWRAVDTQTGQTVALKRFTGAIASNASEVLRADLELLATHALRGHPNVVQVYGGGAEPAPHVAMEYVAGRDLGRELESHGQRLTVERTLEVAVAVASALAAASEAGIVHGDVKPSNILIGSDGVIKLADFNVARVIGYSGASVSGGLLLSFAYAAPEVWDGKQGPASDVYALGCVLYQCLAGRVPFAGAHAEVFRAHLERPPDLAALPAETPDGLRALVDEMLAKDPRMRPSAGSVRDRLERLITSAAAAQPGARGGASLPAAFGRWVVTDPQPHSSWAWRTRHGETGQPATVELYFGDGALGDQLRRAVTVNDQIVPLGAERLLEANRLLLRPGESLGRPAPPGWVFWVARDELVVPPPAKALDRAALATATVALRTLLAAAAGARMALDLSGDNLAVRGDGSIHVRRPGLPTRSGASDPSAAALAAMAGMVEPELRPIVESAGSLDGLAAALGVAGLSNAASAAAFDAPTVMLPAPPPLTAASPAAPPPTSIHVLQSAAGAPPRQPPGTRYARRERSSGGGAGLVAALAGLALLLVAFIAFIAVGGLNPGATPTLPAVGGEPSPKPSGTRFLPTVSPFLPTPLPTTAPTPPPTPVPTVVVTPEPTQPPPPDPTQPPPPEPTQPPPPDPTQPPPTNPPPDPTQPPPQAWQVTISASDDRVQNGERVSILATSNESVTASPWYLQVFNPDTGFIHWSCKQGRTCGGGARRENITTSYQARISAVDGSNVQAQSERITVTWE